MDEKFASLQIWKETHTLFKTLAALNGMKICAFMHRIALTLAADVQPEYLSFEDQDT